MNDNPDPTDQIGKFFDVVPPNKAAATPTSRPVITNPQPQSDPMVKEVQPPAKPPTPPTEPTATPTATAPEPTSDEPNLGVSEEIRQAMIETHGAPPPREETKPETESAPTVTVAAEAQAATARSAADQPQAAPTVAATAATAAAVTPDNPSHIVVGTHRHSFSFWRRTWFILLMLVALVIVVDLLFDLGIIKTTFPHTHFFNKN